MDNSTSQTELLMRYLDGEMSETEKELFERRLASDARLSEELKNLQTAKEAARLFGLKQRVASIHQQMMSEIRPPVIVRKMSKGRRIAKYSLAVAASVLVIGICVLAYDFFSLSSDKLYREKYSSFDLPALRGDNDTSSSEIERAYRQRDYERIIDLSTSRTENIKDKFLTAVSLLEVNRPGEAIQRFNQVIELNKSAAHPVFEDDAEYYLALSYLRIKKYDEALDLMSTIHQNPSHIYHDKFTSGFIRKVKLLKLR